MYKHLLGLYLFIFIAFSGSGFAESSPFVCGNSWEVQEKSFSEFDNPVIGFTVVDFSGTGIHWYVVEQQAAYRFGFKEYFAYDPDLGERAYVSGFEIGQLSPLGASWSLQK